MKLSRILPFAAFLFIVVFTANTVVVAQSSTKPFRPTKSQILAAQEKLKNDGTYSGPADGKYNDDFRAALSAFQASNGLTQTGKLDEATTLKMSIPLTESQKNPSASTAPRKKAFRATKAQITAAQEKLKTSGTYSGPVDGKYNPEFKTSIKAFQEKNSIRSTGTLNRVTIEKMEIELTEAQAAIPANPDDSKPTSATKGKRGPVFRATKEQISNVQSMLKEKGLYDGEQTGKLDDPTRAAIREWQSTNGVKPTGTLNKETLEAMGIELTEKQK
ncbi:MAG: peptidoglycan-binding domain-containing protein [Pyrinomonadaceae bacterium]